MGPACLPRLGKIDGLWGEVPDACANCPLLRGERDAEYCSPHQRVERLWSFFAYKATAWWITMVFTTALIMVVA